MTTGCACSAISSRTTARRTLSSPTLQISSRQLADAAYRALRVAGVVSGVAAEAARDAVVLEHRHARGLDLLERILQVGPPLISQHCAVDGEGVEVDARGACALLLAAPLVALACDQARSTLAIRRLGQPVALEPALVAASCTHGWRFALATADGTPVAAVDRGASVAGAAWSATWTDPLDVCLTADRSGACGPAAARTADPRPRSPAGPVCALALPSDALTVGRASWERLARRAARYLV